METTETKYNEDIIALKQVILKLKEILYQRKKVLELLKMDESSALIDQDIYPGYLIQALNKGKVTIATAGLVAEKKGYFAVVFHTDDKDICFEGPCD
eukprot:14574472-Ditylum_brightwellii.AAC.1